MSIFSLCKSCCCNYNSSKSDKFDYVTYLPLADEVEAGDVILRVNDVDVNRFSTKEVLKCLRLSSDPVTLKLRRDPAIKAHVKRLLSPGQGICEAELSTNSCPSRVVGVDKNSHNNTTTNSLATKTLGNCEDKNNIKSVNCIFDNNSSDNSLPSVESVNQYAKRSNGSYSDASGSSEFEALLPSADSFKEEERAQWEPLSGEKFTKQKNTPRFEAYMMTGDLMLNLSRTQQSSGLLPKYQKKVDSLRYNNHYIHRHHHHNHHHNNHHHHHHHNSVPTSPNEMMGHNRNYNKNNTTSNAVSGGGGGGGGGGINSGGSNSANTSPVGLIKRDVAGTHHQHSHCMQDSKSAISSFGYSSGFVRTSRSEDHLQFQKDPSMSAVDIDIDDDVTSSLNTLLDTRPDSGQGVSSERIVWTYNAPVSSPSASERTSCCQNGSSSQSSSSSTGSNSSSTEDTSPQRSLSPASPTSVSSSVMSSNSGSRRFPLPGSNSCTNTVNPNCIGGSSNNAGTLTPGTQQHLINSLPMMMMTDSNNVNNCSNIAGSGSGGAGAGGGGSSGGGGGYHPTNGDLSQSEAISNMSSPDYNDEETMDILSARDIMMVSDPSDSDSTILASEPPQRRIKTGYNQDTSDHRIVIQVKGPDKDNSNNRNSNNNNTAGSPRQNRRRSSGGNDQRPLSSVSSTNAEFCGYQELKDNDDDREAVNYLYEEQKQSGQSPPQSADEESDIESLHSFHYSPKAVDLPSAVRLAKRLYSLDGFKKSDVSRHLSKNNDFSRAVAEEYLRYFNFEGDTLDVALRKFLAQFSLTGETQERERVLVHFSKRYIDCNPGSFNSQDAVHTLTCAIMLLNTDLHGQNMGRKMSCSQFIENLSELNDGDNFPREVLKQLYTAIKSYPLEWALDDDGDELASQVIQSGDGPATSASGNPFLDVPNVSGATEFKKGYVMRKCCYDANGKKTPFGKRGWKMYYCTLRELVLYLHKDEHGFRNDSLHNAVRIHHALATKASDYTKKQHVFRLQTADQAEYLFQTSDSKELQSWIDTINFVCASFSCQPLAGAVGSQRKFQRPLLPCSHTKLTPREQLRDHEERVSRLEAELEEHRRHPPERGAKALTVQNYKEKDAYLHYELKRYKTYSYLLRSRLAFTEVEPSLVESSIGEVDEGVGGALLNPELGVVPPPVPDRPPTNRYSYRAAIYNRNLLNGQDYGGDIG
ncbi:PH and SEC7 domain-containing protein isoform X3 [Microplitis mediator]|uniref:PH and SEC7 domain-containing protein isoform X3 n=1 Tax=Microplitis mediator TaxID=375433 RepID=UPI0025559D6F|nr:PH and SEC7 domain-containing protein isoform X3 [Microplitis mediator]